MPSKTISVSISEAQAWKLEEIEKRTGISKSGLVQRALMYLFTDKPQQWQSPNGIPSDSITEQLEADFNNKS